MERWAIAITSVNFLCVCCAGPELAAEFGSTLKLRTCVNTWVEEDAMPSWGQLGCNGFIVLDAAGTVVCRSSPAFMEVRTKAFEYVETLIGALLGAPPASIASAGPRPGSAVRLHGLVSRADLNGREAVVVNGADRNGRCAVNVAGQLVSVKLANIEELADAGCGSGGCGKGGCGGGECGEDACGEGECEAQQAGGGCADGTCALPKRAASGDSGDDAAKKGKREAAGGARVPARVCVPSVKVAALDEEHEACSAALHRLATELSPSAASALLGLYESHFAHEEALLDEHVFRETAAASAQPAATAFSAGAGARRSHLADHARLLQGVRALLGGEPIEPSAVEQLATDFEAHASQYDGSYADKLSAALAKATAA